MVALAKKDTKNNQTNGNNNLITPKIVVKEK